MFKKWRHNVCDIECQTHWEAASNFDSYDKFLSFFSSSDYFRFIPNFYEDTMRKFSANGGFKMFHNKLSVIYQVIGDNFPMRCHFKVHFSSTVY